MIDISDLTLKRLSLDFEFSDFDCEIQDLNEFLKDDAVNYANELMAVTYLLYDKQQLAAFFTFQNDKISYDVQRKSDWNAVSRVVNNDKRNRRGGYPAVKIGRLGIDKKYKGQKIGTQILDYTKMSFVTNNKTGCRFITVDAYNSPDVITFYEKNRFKMFPAERDNDDKTKAMYFDLKTFLSAV